MKSYKQFHPIDLTVSEGETKILVGPSGCGKSTYLAPKAVADSKLHIWYNIK
ncbi:MAG: ATP-binding cassette domain-containing protein [Candidatus Marinimicrobia bacterium]|nr:ATP-binding cassette domain-containing protein [Candidatus Neomarinimicrobiota bacterium]